jgi:hypothetical protein
MLRSKINIFLLVLLPAVFSFTGEDDKGFSCTTALKWRKIKDYSLYSFEVPDWMVEVNDLNDQANHQFQFVKQAGPVLQELYLIILSDTYEELQGADIEYTTSLYWDFAAANLEAMVTEYKILTRERYVEELNGMECVKGHIEGRFGDIYVSYLLAIFKGKHGFYQVLTWTIRDQKGMFIRDMNGMIESFKEKK